jgi:large repetitive protein
MIRSNVYERESIRLLALLLAIAASASAAAPALAQSSGIWEKTGNMKNGRDAAPATLLQNGKVLVAGGDGSGGLLTGAELYNPANGQCAATGSLNTAGAGPLTLLQNGHVLVTGADAELYNPSTGT